MKVNLNIEGKQYQVKIDDLNTRPIIAEVNGQAYEVWPEDEQAPIPSRLTEMAKLLPST